MHSINKVQNKVSPHNRESGIESSLTRLVKPEKTEFAGVNEAFSGKHNDPDSYRGRGLYRQTLLIIGCVWPEPDSSAAGSRMMQLIHLFLAQGWKITFASPAADSDFAFDVQKLGIEKANIKINDDGFDTFVQKLNPSITLFDRFMTEEQFGWRVAEHCPGSMRILDTEDLHCLRFARQKAIKENTSLTKASLITDVAKREVASIFRCDLSLVISSFEMELLQKEFKVDESLLLHLPFMLSDIVPADVEAWPIFEARNHFISIGNFLHEPNWNAVLFLKEEIWPQIRKELPKAEMHVYGAYPSQKVHALNQPKTGFLIKGRAADAKAVMKKARVCLAPLRFGAGIKGKLTEAMMCGTPSVTTDIGAEAMHGKLPWSGLIANNATDIAQAAIELYQNQEMWETAQINGINIINTFYNKELLGNTLLERLKFLTENLENHRLNNFIGAMLLHHSIASTKYMARWIEAKNRG
ncbi:MAG: glycosyltransferase family 4 protein [Bacteroidetes bacterium]|nr:glycosyltransferase family 4 protein [Bacteroidota bacterium]